MLNTEIINKITPKARDDYAKALVNGQEVFDEYKVNTPLRLASFLATICHETGGLTIVRENMNYTAARIKQVWPTRPEAKCFAGEPRELANCVYNGRMGNATGSDDGWNFRGGGLIQLTGRYSYRAAGLAIGVNLESQPELIEDADIALKAACWEFSKYLEFCDKGEKGFRSVCNGINRGNPLSKYDPIGWSDRQIWFQRCCDALGVGPRVEDDFLSYGDQGSLVKTLQERLKTLGYAIGRADGIFGSRTRAAVLTFQAENKLDVDGIVGPKTRAALNAETAAPMPLGERAEETIKDLKEAGSTTLAAAGKLKTAALITGAVSGAAGTAQEVGLLEGAGDLLKELTTLKTTTNGFVDVINWGVTHWYLGAVIVAFMVWKFAKDIEFRRHFEHVTGINLNR